MTIDCGLCLWSNLELCAFRFVVCVTSQFHPQTGNCFGSTSTSTVFPSQGNFGNMLEVASVMVHYVTHKQRIREQKGESERSFTLFHFSNYC